MKGFRDIATKKPKKGEFIKPTAGFIYVAGEYPEWKKDILLFLQSQLVDGALPKTITSSLKEYVSSTESLSGRTKDCMQFAMFQIQQIPSVGATEALALSMPFDEFGLLVERYLSYNIVLLILRFYCI